MTPRLATGLALTICLGLAAAAAALPALYTQAQAAAGARVYAQDCALCHGDALQGEAGPPLTGAQFAASAGSIGAVFTLLAEQMPAGQPGSLSHAQYEDVMAYILSRNGYPAGARRFDYAAGLTANTALVSPAP